MTLPKDPKSTVKMTLLRFTFALTVTVTVGFSFGWYTTQYISQNYSGVDTVSVMDTVWATGPEAQSAVIIPQTITFYDTLVIPRFETLRDTIRVRPILVTPPRPWKSNGRP